MKKEYRLVSTPWCITFLTIVLLFVLYAFSSAAGFYNVESMSDPQLVSSCEGNYISIHVERGDTLWDIAKNYGDSGTDIRDTIQTICEINHISADSLRYGTTILVPAES